MERVGLERATTNAAPDEETSLRLTSLAMPRTVTSAQLE